MKRIALIAAAMTLICVIIWLPEVINSAQEAPAAINAWKKSHLDTRINSEQAKTALEMHQNGLFTGMHKDEIIRKVGTPSSQRDKYGFSLYYPVKHYSIFGTEILWVTINFDDNAHATKSFLLLDAPQGS